MNKYKLRGKIKCGGCGSKFPPKILQELLSGFNENLDKSFIHFDESEDACVLPLNNTKSIVQTVDIIYPNVDDPFIFGRVATLNAVSDIYAMGADPVVGLNIAEFSSNLDSEILQQILEGAFMQSKLEGFNICGGHTIEGDSLKFGMSVMGFLDPAKILRNSGASPKELIVLTKPIGTGMYSEALKHSLLTKDDQIDFEKLLLTSNKTASRILREFKVSSMTDVSGFGLAVHLYRLLCNSSVSARIEKKMIPILPKLNSLSLNKSLRNTYKNNHEVVKNNINADIEDSVLFDPQTNGGLLFTTTTSELKKIDKDFQLENLELHIIGQVERKEENKSEIKVI